MVYDVSDDAVGDSSVWFFFRLTQSSRKVGYPDYQFNDTVLEGYYEDVSLEINRFCVFFGT